MSKPCKINATEGEYRPTAWCYKCGMLTCEGDTPAEARAALEAKCNDRDQPDAVHDPILSPPEPPTKGHL